MHELSIASSIIDLALDKAKENKAERITKIEMELGKLAGVVIDALLFCFEAVCKDTIAEGSVLDIKEMGAEGLCMECSSVFAIDSLFTSCGACGSYKVSINKGKELSVKAIIVE